ncbi:MAG TPA: class I lanthipeptide [Thermoanaerobaculia bacterium]|nr:class I lanthipeptide [Thermoanaerobaculia bacterium]
MKKHLKKRLVLHRETLTALDQLELKAAAGGATSPRACPYSGYQTCGTCQATCTTNFC